MGYSSKLKYVPSIFISSDGDLTPSFRSTRAATYRVIIDTLKHLPDTKLDAAYGLSGLVFLYVVRYTLRKIEAKARNPVVKKLAFFGQTLRTAFVIIFLTIFSWVHLRNKTVANYDISILKTVPGGFKHLGQPQLPTKLLSLIAPQLPVSTIILLLEHIAIAKSFGRVNNYKIRADQELVSIGVTNMVGTLFSAYPATGSFSRSAIKAKGELFFLLICSRNETVLTERKL
jgi:sodium-independent sulfate anion transporter 11